MFLLLVPGDLLLLGVLLVAVVRPRSNVLVVGLVVRAAVPYCLYHMYCL